MGVQEEVALNEISGNDWTIQREVERSDEYPEPGMITRTVPAAGIKLDEGDTFVIYVSEGPELRTLPELNGLPVADAQAALTDLALVPVVAEAQYSEDIPAGSVISWTVQDDVSLVAGDQVLPGTSIVLVPSQGPPPRPAPNFDQHDPRRSQRRRGCGATRGRRGRAALQQRCRGRAAS